MKWRLREVIAPNPVVCRNCCRAMRRRSNWQGSRLFMPRGCADGAPSNGQALEHPDASLRFTLALSEGVSMSVLPVLYVGDEPTLMRLKVEDRAGAPATPFAPPVWSLSDTGVVELEPAEDGLTA